MSGFELSPEHEDFRKVVRDFAEKVIGPHVAEWDKAHHFPVDVVRSMGELGLMGLTAPEEYDKLGWRISDTHPLTFTDCRVPAENLLGERGRGFAQFLAILDDGRVAIAALTVGLLQACLDECVRYANQRQTIGGPIGRKQGVAFQIADLEVMLQASRLLVYKAAAMRDAMEAKAPGAPSMKEFKQAASIAKLYATDSAVTATRIAPRSSAATASWRSTRWRGSTATPRSSRSARAPARSSECSSHAASGSRWSDRGRQRAVHDS
jgi:alkylation response protein AidB-like acyl-CoA dehydrogenase